MLLINIDPSYAEARSNVLKQRECLSRIVYSESRGEPKKGQLAVAHASINRAIKTTGNTCTIKGVTRKKIPKVDRGYFTRLSEFALFHKSNVAQADSWNTGSKPMSKGKVVRKISAHVFYIMAKL
jgi:spore germination cell wall hydrolase CwlJ-like protein